MLPNKCDQCGRFYSGPSHDIYANPPQNGIDREVCGNCWSRGASSQGDPR